MHATDIAGNAGEVANCNSNHGKPTCHEAHLGFSIHISVQSSCGFNRIGNGSAATQSDFGPRNRADKGNGET